MQRLPLLVGVSFVTLLWTMLPWVFPAHAQEAVCTEDVQQFCPDASTGARRLRCLNQHYETLSEPCQARLAGMRKYLQEEGESCRDDVDRLCPEAAPGRERMQCLRQHKNDLSTTCRHSLQAMRVRRLTRGRSCHEDVARFCSDTAPGTGNIIECLKAHEAELSDVCKAILAARERRNTSR